MGIPDSLPIGWVVRLRCCRFEPPSLIFCFRASFDLNRSDLDLAGPISDLAAPILVRLACLIRLRCTRVAFARLGCFVRLDLGFAQPGLTFAWPDRCGLAAFVLLSRFGSAAFIFNFYDFSLQEKYMSEFPVSMIHPDAPEILSAVALLNAPIDLEEVVARVGKLWNGDIVPEREEGGKILRFTLHDVVVLLSELPGPATPERGELPAHDFHVAITCFAPLNAEGFPGLADGAEDEADRALDAPGAADGAEDEADGISGGPDAADKAEAGMGASDEALALAISRKVNGIPSLAGEGLAELTDPSREIALRRRSLAAHVVLAKVADAIMREEAAVGLYRSELGIVQPPDMISQLASLLSRGEAPVPLWVGIHVVKPDLVCGRTLGLPLFGHLDLEVVDSMHSEEEVFSMFASLVYYVLFSDGHFLPGQSIEYEDGAALTIAQGVSPTDGGTILRIGY